MNKDKIIKKIKKCLALSKSANANEASIALRQANLLMSKHSIDLQTVESDITENKVKSTSKSRPPLWQQILVRAIADAFQCDAIFQQHWTNSSFIFIGEEPKPEVASYAYGVLHAQLSRAATQYIIELEITCEQKLNRSQKIISSKQFKESFVQGLALSIKKFAAPLTKPLKDKIQHHIDSRSNLSKETLNCKSSFKNDVFCTHAQNQGYNAGRKAQIYAGVNSEYKAPVKLTHQRDYK